MFLLENIMKKNILHLILLACLVGCSKQKIKLERKFNRIEHANKYTADFSQEQQQVTLSVKKLTPTDCIYFFNVNCISCGYQPIQCTINNLSQNSILLNPANIGLQIVSPKKVAQKCHWKTKEIVGITGIASAIYCWPILIPIAYAGLIMQSKNVRISKKMIQEDVLQNWDMIKIRPMETMSKIVFVEAGYIPSTFNVGLFSKETKEILEYNVKL